MSGVKADSSVVSDDVRVRPQDLHAFCVRALMKVGVREQDARTTADVLVATDTWGTFTHGVKSLRGYVRRLRGGGLRTDAAPEIVNEGPAWAIVDGNSVLAMVTSVFAMQTAIAKARQAGVGFAGVRNSCHFGGAGYYAAMAAEQGMIGLAMANDIPSVTAPGARGSVMGSNPLGYAVPAGHEPPVVLDMATSIVAGGKVMAAKAHGKSIPPDWVIDRDGVPSTNPDAFLNGGTLMPMAGHKGYGIALLIEVLSGVLTDAALRRDVVAWITGDPALPTGHGAAFLAINVGAMMPLERFKKRMDSMIQDIHAGPKAPGVERIFVPGEMEAERRSQALETGILLPADVVTYLRGLGQDVDLDTRELLGD